MDYFFSINYEPLIRNNSISTNISDSTQRSFQVTLDLTFNIQLPIFLFDNNLQNVESININYGNYGLEAVSSYPVQKIISDNITKDHSKTVKWQLLFVDGDTIVQRDDTNNTTRVVLQPNPDSIKLDSNNTYNFVNNGEIHKDVPHQFFEAENKVIFDFPTTYFNENFNISKHNPFIIQIVEPFSSKRTCNDRLRVST